MTNHFITLNYVNLRGVALELEKCAVRLKTNYLWDHYRQLCNQFNQAGEDSKIEHDSKLMNYLYQNRNNISDKKWWKLSKDFGGTKELILSSTISE